MVKGGERMNIQDQYINAMASKGSRIDGRKLDESRKLTIEKDVIENAEGSAKVKLGDTEVIAGVKLDVGEPFPDTPNEGVLIVNAELSPLASPEFELGPPREDAIELARIVDRGIRESKCIDREKLCIKKGEKVWMVFVDIQPLNHNGNLIDASGIAAIEALLNTKMPEYDGEKVNYEKKKKSLPVSVKPVPVTLAQINNTLVVDPGMEEEDVMSSRITIVTKEKGNICAIQKGGKSGFSMERVEEAIDIAIKKGEEIRKML
ncbi:MAG: exosome complex protein Rrp42 [Candidatus Aenigmarchaeota archaeon]|nr:exosome complex protein Rrp42 [Candidatus Aenigmarchaeota archaeon]